MNESKEGSPECFCINLHLCLPSSYLKQQVEVFQESLSRLENQMVVVNHWQQSVMSRLKHYLDLLNLTFVASGPSSVKVASWVKVLQAAEQTHMNDCDKLFQKVSVTPFFFFCSVKFTLKEIVWWQSF